MWIDNRCDPSSKPAPAEAGARDDDDEARLPMRPDDKDNSSSLPRIKLAFLGPEFLTWLFFHIDQEGGEIDLEKLAPGSDLKDTMRIAVGKRISLKPLVDSELRVVVSSAMLDDSGEVLSAIRSGAYVDSLMIDTVIGERIYNFTLNASDGSISQVKMRFVFDEKDQDEDFSPEGKVNKSKAKAKLGEEELILLRMSALDEIEDIVDGLFGRFLTRRLAQAFISEDISTIRRTVARGLEAIVPMLKEKPTQVSLADAVEEAAV